MLEQSAAPPTQDALRFHAPCSSNAWSANLSSSVHLIGSYTKAGLVRADIGILRSGGLMATYYVGDLEGEHRHHISRVDLGSRASHGQDFHFAGNLSSAWPWRSFSPLRVDSPPATSTVEHVSAGAVSLTESTGWRAWSPEALCDCSAGGCCSPSFSTRWTGWWRPGTEGTCFNVTAVLPSPGDRVRLWLDAALMIDQWSSLSSTAPALGATRKFESGGALYGLKVEYKHFTGDQGLKLTWANCSGVGAAAEQTLSAHNGSLLWLAQVPGPQTGVTARIHPGPPAALTSTAAGAGLTQATAGISSRFSLTIRDAFRNLASLTSLPAKPAFPAVQASEQNAEAGQTLSPLRILVHAAGGSTTPVALLPLWAGSQTTAVHGALWSGDSGHVTRAGLHSLHVSLASCAQGLAATYYNYSNLTR